jgi:hypothetical protein
MQKHHVHPLTSTNQNWLLQITLFQFKWHILSFIFSIKSTNTSCENVFLDGTQFLDINALQDTSTK